MLQWSPPSFDGGSEITVYIISVTPSPSGGTTCPGGQCNTTGLSFNVTGLTPNVNYQFNISAVNSAGEGESASINGAPLGTGMLLYKCSMVYILIQYSLLLLILLSCVLIILIMMDLHYQ